MKKIYTLLMCALFATSVFAQSPFVVGPSQFNGHPTELLGESMSQNHNYVVGTDQATQRPMVWNTVSNDLFEITVPDSVWVDFGDGTGYMDHTIMTGTFHGVNNAGIAVGSLTGADYVSHPIMASVNGNGDYTVLFQNEGESGCEAYAISENGIIAGFYFTEDWTTYACVWTENGTVRTDLPIPTSDQIEFPLDYVSARWISSDANTILGYAQDSNTGAWVACAWQMQNGEYVFRSLSNGYFQTYYYDNNGELILPGDNPYFDFAPTALSSDGQWVALSVTRAYDLSDWDADATPRVARMNLNTMALEVLSLDFEYTEIEAFGIANNGTCVGRLAGMIDPLTMSQDVYGMIWNVRDTTVVNVASLYPEDPYASDIFASALSFITADARYAMGYSANNDGDWTTFYVELPVSTEAIDEVSAQVALYPNPATTQVNVAVDGQIRSINVLNAMGQVVMTQNSVNGNQAVVNVQNLAAGIYFVNVLTDKGMATKRISVVK